jgi:hypothetical protein
VDDEWKAMAWFSQFFVPHWYFSKQDEDIRKPGIRAMPGLRLNQFAFEGERWFDLKRTGKAVEILSNRKDGNGNVISFAKNINQNRLLWPIPQSQIDNNPNLTQNPGY